MTEVLNCGGGHRTRLSDCLLCFGVTPAPVYNGGEEEAGRPCRALQEEGVLLELQVLVGFPLVEGGEGRERERE